MVHQCSHLQWCANLLIYNGAPMFSSTMVLIFSSTMVHQCSHLQWCPNVLIYNGAPMFSFTMVPQCSHLQRCPNVLIYNGAPMFSFTLVPKCSNFSCLFLSKFLATKTTNVNCIYRCIRLPNRRFTFNSTIQVVWRFLPHSLGEVFLAQTEIAQHYK
jgi:hypothetical protein